MANKIIESEKVLIAILPTLALDANIQQQEIDRFMQSSGDLPRLVFKDILKFNISANAICAIFMSRTKTKILDRREFCSDLYSKEPTPFFHISSYGYGRKAGKRNKKNKATM